MPEREMSSTATWPLPELDRVEIVYTTEDRFDDGDPNYRYAQAVNGKIVGIAYDEGDGDATRVPLGTLTLTPVRLDYARVRGGAGSL